MASEPNPLFTVRRRNLQRIARDAEKLALLTEHSGADAFDVPCIDAFLRGARDISDTEAQAIEALLGAPEGALSNVTWTPSERAAKPCLRRRRGIWVCLLQASDGRFFAGAGHTPVAAFSDYVTQ